MLEPDPRPRQVNEIRERSSNISLDAVGTMLIDDVGLLSIETEQGTQNSHYKSEEHEAYALDANCLVVTTYGNSHRYELYENFAAKNTTTESTKIEARVEEIVDRIYSEKM